MRYKAVLNKRYGVDKSIALKRLGQVSRIPAGKGMGRQTYQRFLQASEVEGLEMFFRRSSDDRRIVKKYSKNWLCYSPS